MNDLTYADLYSYDHNVHFVTTLANLFGDAFGVYARGYADNMLVRVYGVDVNVMRQLVDDLGLTHCVHDVAYDYDYDYDDNTVVDTDCVLLYCNYNLYDLDDL